MRIALLMLADAVLLNAALFFALWVRMEFNMGQLLKDGLFIEFINTASVYTVIGLFVFFMLKLYTSLWKFASVYEFVRIGIACIIVSIANYIAMRLFGFNVPRSHPVLNFFFLCIFVTTVRFSYRLFRKRISETGREKRTMLIGAGSAASVALREFSSSAYSENKVVCIIDDDRTKQGQYLKGVKIIGGRDMIVSAVKKYNVSEIIVAMPSVPNRQRKEILDICQQTTCKLKTLPGIFQLANGEVNISKIRDVEIEDLLGRDPVKVDLTDILDYVSNRVILVTGGGGSIGSELCRQIASHNPKTLIIFDIYENNAYDIQLELKRRYPSLDLQVLIGSVRDRERIRKLFAAYRPELVFHAAAHKHVPLMEHSPNEAIKNNVFGTLNVALAADEFHARRMILISTDKAVNPTNVMGASKRICEMIVQTMDMRSKTEYVAVRFGNVLGSNGSVIPLFHKQILDGGPITVTHKDVIRYFMTIPEAVSLVLQAGAYAEGGEIFVLDMGKPVRIDDLARNMIKLSGLEPDVDIPIVYTGLRPGEKLYEELLLSEEGLKKTDNELIYIAHRIEFDDTMFERNVERLREACNSSEKELRALLHEIVKEYKEAS